MHIGTSSLSPVQCTHSQPPTPLPQTDSTIDLTVTDRHRHCQKQEQEPPPVLPRPKLNEHKRQSASGIPPSPPVLPRPKMKEYKRHSLTGIPPTSPAASPKCTRSHTLEKATGKHGTIPAVPALPSSVARPTPLKLPATFYPHYRYLSRSPPNIAQTKRFFSTQHHSTPRAIAATGSYRLATASIGIRLWNLMGGTMISNLSPSSSPMAHQDITDKVTTLVFAPSLQKGEDGQFLWAGLEDGRLVVMDTVHNQLMRSSCAHRTTILFMVRVRNQEIWTVDEDGILRRWPACTKPDQAEPDPCHHRVTPFAAAMAVITTDEHDCCILTQGDTLDIYLIRSETMEKPTLVRRVPSTLGIVTQLCILPAYNGDQTHLACAHEKGVLSIWNTETWEIGQVIHVSAYGITAMTLSLNHYLWTGFKTGVIHVYDISKPIEWVLVKAWEAHSSPIVKMVVNDASLAMGNTTPLLQVLSLDYQGNVAVWDGLLEEYQKDQQIQSKEADYCNYRDTSILICSWNIGACQPESITGDNRLGLKGWLESMKDPDIIVVGIQEIVDIESKRQTAKSIFYSRKKREQTTADPDPSLIQAAIPQYNAWQKCITGLLNESYDTNVYELVKSESLVGLFSLVFIRKEHHERLSHVESAVVKTGLRVMNRSLHGNKGAVVIRLVLDDAPICFVNCHLAAGQNRIEARNGDTEEILKATKFGPVLSGTEQGDNPLDHLHCFLSGDLNYRVDVHTRDSIIRQFKGDRDKARLDLLKDDQLIKQRTTNPLLKLSLFEEHIINFDPTYKYNVGTDVYDSSVKQRVPAWCDRILYRNVPRPIFYDRHEVLTSDHRPISAGFVLPVRMVRKPDKDKVVLDVEKTWCLETLPRIVKEHKLRYVMEYERCDEGESRQRLDKCAWDVEAIVCNVDDHNTLQTKV